MPLSALSTARPVQARVSIFVAQLADLTRKARELESALNAHVNDLIIEEQKQRLEHA